ncbi:hypothetical protein FALCPG4_015244 [Fusarium falciforme]
MRLINGEMAMGSMDHPPQTPWDEWWAMGASTLPSPPQVADHTALYVLDEPQFSAFVPDYAAGSYPTASLGSTHAQQYPELPPSASESTFSSNPPVSIGAPEVGRRSSSSSHPEKRKQRTNADDGPASKSSRRGTPRTKNPTRTGRKAGGNSNARRASSPMQQPESDAAAGCGSPPEQQQQQADDHTRRVQERNRIASNKLRIKKREDAARLKSDEEAMERLNRDLATCVADLMLEVYNLKMRLLQHTDCDCALIRSYIANEANRYIKDLGDHEHEHEY